MITELRCPTRTAWSREGEFAGDRNRIGRHEGQPIVRSVALIQPLSRVRPECLVNKQDSSDKWI
jgi:hypothetical protein